MTLLRRHVVDLGRVAAAVISDDLTLFDYLREFYPLLDSGEVAWSIDARRATPESDMATTPWRVGYRADVGTRCLMIRSTDPQNLAITTRKAIREVLLDYCGRRQYTMLHASAVLAGERLIMVVGDKGSGKTTLALCGVLTDGHQFVSNDHLILYRSDGRLVVTSLPTPIPVKIGTYLDYAELLGPPWHDEGVDIGRFRGMTARKRYSYDQRLLYTYRALGCAGPPHVDLVNREVVVVLAGYAPPGARIAPPTHVDDRAAALWPHVRFDWVFDPALNNRHLPRVERDRNSYARDARMRLDELTAGALVVRWEHHGRLGPLLAWLDQGARGRR